MRHSKKRHKLGVSGQHRLALLANLSVSLITHGRIKTTLAKAKALRPFVEKVITLAKKAESSNEAERKLHYRRLAISRINNPAAVALLFDNRVAEFMERTGGYTRIYKIGQRIGDAAEMALIELIDGNDEGYPNRPSRKTTGKSVIKDTDKTEVDLVADKTVEVQQPEAEVTIKEPEADIADESSTKESDAKVDNEDGAEESSAEKREKAS
jgi:large subunit ribosomal protein L17